MILDALVFDFDGLILDTETPIFEEWRATFRERGQELGLDVWQHALGTFGGYDPCTHLAKLTGEDFDHEALRQEVRARNMVRCEALPQPAAQDVQSACGGVALVGGRVQPLPGRAGSGLGRSAARWTERSPGRGIWDKKRWSWRLSSRRQDRPRLKNEQTPMAFSSVPQPQPDW